MPTSTTTHSSISVGTTVGELRQLLDALGVSDDTTIGFNEEATSTFEGKMEYTLTLNAGTTSARSRTRTWSKAGEWILV